MMHYLLIGALGGAGIAASVALDRFLGRHEAARDARGARR